MKTKILLVCAISIIVLVNSFGQVQIFDLSKYKVADYKRSRLDINFYSNGNENINKIFYDTLTNKYNSSNYNSAINFNYRIDENSRKKQRSISFSTNFSPINFVNSKSEAVGDNYYNSFSETKSNRSNLNLQLSLENRYYNENNHFFHFELNSNYELLNYKATNSYFANTNQYDNETKSNSQYSQSNIKIGIGVGRIENVEDARMALFILNDLSVKNKLSRQPTDEEVLDFASKITQLKNKRFFDYRLRRIYEIQSLDTFLREKNLVNEIDVIYFTSVSDNWEYSNNPVRQSGKRFTLNISPDYTYNFEKSFYKNNIPETNEYYNQTGTIGFNGEWMNCKPLSLKWQRDYSIQLGILKAWFWTTDSINIDYKWNGLNAAFNYEYGYYPNSRSYYTVRFSSNLYKKWYQSDKNLNNYFDLAYSLNLGLSSYYYVSERLKVNGNIGMDYSNNTYPDLSKRKRDNSYRPYYNIQLTYSLF